LVQRGTTSRRRHDNNNRQNNNSSESSQSRLDLSTIGRDHARSARAARPLPLRLRARAALTPATSIRHSYLATKALHPCVMPACKYGGSGCVGVADATSAGLAAHLRVQAFRFRFRSPSRSVEHNAARATWTARRFPLRPVTVENRNFYASRRIGQRIPLLPIHRIPSSRE